MSRTDRARAGGKNPIKKRLERVEKATTEGIDWLVEDIRTIFANTRAIAEALDTIDVQGAALRTLLVKKGIITEEEYDKECKAILALKTKIQAEQVAAEALAADAEQVKQSAQRAALGDQYPEEAFIFGG